MTPIQLYEITRDLRKKYQDKVIPSLAAVHMINLDPFLHNANFIDNLWILNNGQLSVKRSLLKLLLRPDKWDEKRYGPEL